ncbi:MAG: helix-turn-helix protein [Herbinix sp.]|nr:helix-turn-helix protein [Herbinix sp.]
MLDNIQIMGKVTLKELRMLTGLTQKEFAEKVEIPFTTYRRYESYPANMEAGRLFKACEILGVSISIIKL